MLGIEPIAARLHRYALLLALLLVAIAIQSIDVRYGGSALLSDLFRTLLGIAVVLVVFERPRERVAMGVVLAAALAIGWWPYLGSGSLGRGAGMALHALMSAFFGAAAWVIVRDLFRRPPLGGENVLGAICGYLLVGNAWGSVNALAYLLAPNAYGISSEVVPLLDDWRGRLALFTYYGYAQLLTIGYADVTPVRAPATTLSIFAALFGVFYMAVVVSQLVTLAQLVHRERR